MSRMFTWQEYLRAQDKEAALLDAVNRYKKSAEFHRALEANAYFAGRNTAVAQKTIVKARKLESTDANGRKRVRCAMEDVAGNRIGSNFLFRFICQQNCYLLQNGCIAKPEAKALLGDDFDRTLLALGEKALLHGTAWGFWNTDRLEVLAMAENRDCGFLPLLDEFTGSMVAGVQFWQLGSGCTAYVRFFEADGFTVYEVSEGMLKVCHPKRPYRLARRRDALGEAYVDEGAWPALPIIPLHANAAHMSEFTPSIKAKIDAYDRILSDFADNLDRANDIYWVLNNFGGTTDDIISMLTEINRIKAVASISDGSGAAATAEPHTVEVPHEARRTALALLERALYADYMALNIEGISTGALTNVAIRALYANLDLKSSHYEWEVAAFVSKLLALLGCGERSVRFNRQCLVNEAEIVSAIATMRDDIDREAALRLNPMLESEDVTRILAAHAAQTSAAQGT